jgi:hypothetical protein
VRGPQPGSTPTTFSTVVQTGSPFVNDAQRWSTPSKTGSSSKDKEDDDCVLRLMVDDYYEFVTVVHGP